MSDATTVQDEVSDDWTAALNEQNAAAGGDAASVDDAFAAAQDARPAANPAVFQQFDGSGSRPGTRNDIDLVLDIPVQLTVELGRTKVPVAQLLKMDVGTVVELDRQVGEAVEIYVNDRLVARGEIVLVESRLGVTMTEIIKAA